MESQETSSGEQLGDSSLLFVYARHRVVCDSGTRHTMSQIPTLASIDHVVLLYCHFCHHSHLCYCYCYHRYRLGADFLMERQVTLFCVNSHGQIETKIGNYLGNVDILLVPVHPSEDLHQARYRFYQQQY